MALSPCNFLRRISQRNVKHFSTAVEAIQIKGEPIQIFRTTEDNPANHSTNHLNRFYTIPANIEKQLFQHGGLSKHFLKQVKSFNECSILVRQPAVEIMSYIRNSDYSKPVNRYVLYGRHGSGKSITLAHLVHFGLMNKHILVHAPLVRTWFQFPKEVASSLTREGSFDLPLDAAAWLVHFKTQNNALLAELDLKVSKDYTWSQRESTPSGAKITDLIDHGVNRIKYACEVIIALMCELKEASIAGKCKLLVAIDGYNSFFCDETSIKDEKKTFIAPERISLMEAFTNIAKYDWCNGAVILTVDKYAVKAKMDSDLPRYLLGKSGFENLDPFVPICVENYTEREFEIVMEYYKNRKWIRNVTEEGQRELELLSGRNPYQLMNYCTPL